MPGSVWGTSNPASLRNPANSKYGFQQGHPAFRRAASDYVHRRFGHRFDPATELVPLIGSKEGLAHMPFAFLNPGDMAIVPEPGYQAYLGGTVSPAPAANPAPRGRGFLVDVDGCQRRSCRRRGSSSQLSQQPTAAVASLEYLERVVAICRKHEIILAYDNAYCDIVFDGYRAPSIFEVPGADEVAIEFFSLSKSFSMTGWRIGFAVGRAPFVGPLTQVKTYTDTGPFLAVQEAGHVRQGGGADRADLRGDRPRRTRSACWGGRLQIELLRRRCTSGWAAPG
jgi:LL-diaminopimelate aminotransferase